MFGSPNFVGVLPHRLIDTPTHVGPGLPPVAPPGVNLAGDLGVQAPVNIHPAQCLKHPGEPSPLFVQEAAVLQVAFLVFRKRSIEHRIVNESLP